MSEGIVMQLYQTEDWWRYLRWLQENRPRKLEMFLRKRKLKQHLDEMVNQFELLAYRLEQEGWQRNEARAYARDTFLMPEIPEHTPILPGMEPKLSKPAAEALKKFRNHWRKKVQG